MSIRAKGTSVSPTPDGTTLLDRRFNRRSLIAKGIGAAAVLPLTGLLSESADAQQHREGPTHGDFALLRFAAAAELIETDMWQQYNELGGIQDSEVPGGSGSPAYTAAIAVLDSDMAQYIHDNTQDEVTHELFLNGYLMANGAAPADLTPFMTLPSSKATGAQQIGRLTNLMQLTLDTGWWTRYRDPRHNPDLDPGFVFPPAVPGLLDGQFTAIPRTDADLAPSDHLQAIANTAGFHFASIEVGGTSLYPSLAQRATHPDALQILLSIGPVEAMHFQTWHDKAGNAPAITDPTNGLTFPDLSNAGQLLQPNLIMPEPCPFLNRRLPICSVIRPTQTRGAANAALMGLTGMGIFIGQSQAFFDYMKDLADDADAARRGN